MNPMRRLVEYLVKRVRTKSWGGLKCDLRRIFDLLYLIERRRSRPKSKETASLFSELFERGVVLASEWCFVVTVKFWNGKSLFKMFFTPSFSNDLTLTRTYELVIDVWWSVKTRWFIYTNSRLIIPGRRWYLKYLSKICAEKRRIPGMGKQKYPTPM